MIEPKLGDLATCKLCGHRIEFVGSYWRHVGGFVPRHPAQPKGGEDFSTINGLLERIRDQKPQEG